jgi:1,4-dihydroxy-2-naphthoate octaprenyltransferase
VSLHGAWVRWGMSTAWFVVCGVGFGVWWPTALWGGVVLLHNFGQWSHHWGTKSLSMGLGVFAQLSAAWLLVGPFMPWSVWWLVFLAMAIMLVVPLQDLRDVAGDRARGRVTLPIGLGEQVARRYLIGGFLALPVALALLVAHVSSSPVIVGSQTALCAAWCWTIAVRIGRYRTPRADHLTYLLFPAWYCCALASAILVALGRV